MMMGVLPFKNRSLSLWEYDQLNPLGKNPLMGACGGNRPGRGVWCGGRGAVRCQALEKPHLDETRDSSRQRQCEGKSLGHCGDDAQEMVNV